jgi:cell wall-associated NlpC family hydrolase
MIKPCAIDKNDPMEKKPGNKGIQGTVKAPVFKKPAFFYARSKGMPAGMLFVLGFFMFIASCRSTPPDMGSMDRPDRKPFSIERPEMEEDPSPMQKPPTQGRGEEAKESRSRFIEWQIRSEFELWEGTRHKLGGMGLNGVDCSGFVRHVYQKLFNIELPRTTKGQVTRGRQVKRSELRAGDLVFFKPPYTPRHVGIYLGDGEFVHTSSRKGVVISRIGPAYWSKYFWTGRRILPD